MNLKELEKLSPYPINYVNKWRYEHGAFFPKFSTFYCRIEINKDLSEDVKLATLAHEVGHALCYKKGCKCMEYAHELGTHISSKYTMTEYHANKFAIKFLLENKQKEALKDIIKVILEDSQDYFNGAHQKACKKIMKLKLWKKALDFVEEN